MDAPETPRARASTFQKALELLRRRYETAPRISDKVPMFGWRNGRAYTYPEEPDFADRQREARETLDELSRVGAAILTSHRELSIAAGVPSDTLCQPSPAEVWERAVAELTPGNNARYGEPQIQRYISAIDKLVIVSQGWSDEVDHPLATRSKTAAAARPPQDPYEWARQVDLVVAVNQVLGPGHLTAAALSRACRDREIETNAQSGILIRVKVASFLAWAARKWELPKEETDQIRNAVIGESHARNTAAQHRE